MKVTLAILAVGIVAFVLALAGVRTYGIPGKTLNGGITYGRCGVEIWGEPGHFCDVD